MGGLTLTPTLRLLFYKPIPSSSLFLSQDSPGMSYPSPANSCSCSNPRNEKHVPIPIPIPLWLWLPLYPLLARFCMHRPHGPQGTAPGCKQRALRAETG